MPMPMPMPMPIASDDAPDTTPLQAHFQQCALAGRPGHRWHCAAEAIGAFVARRLVSVLLIGGLLAWLLSWPFGSR